MEKLLPYVSKLIESESKIISVAIIEGENNIVYTTENWDISQEIDKIISIWDSGESNNITILGLKCVVIQNTTEKFVAITLKDSLFEGGIVGFKDDERKIICKTAPDGHLLLGFTEASKILRTWKPFTIEDIIKPEPKQIKLFEKPLPPTKPFDYKKIKTVFKPVKPYETSKKEIKLYEEQIEKASKAIKRTKFRSA